MDYPQLHRHGHTWPDDYRCDDDVVSIVVGAVFAGELSTKRISFYIGGWSLHQEEIRNRKIVRKYIEYYSGRFIKPFKIMIPGIKNLKRPKKPK